MTPDRKRHQAKNIEQIEFDRWLGHPTTQLFLGYLKDHAAEIRNTWFQGENWTEEARHAVADYESVATVDLKTIKDFYQEESEEDGEEQREAG